MMISPLVMTSHYPMRTFQMIIGYQKQDSYVSKLDEPDFLVTPLSDANEDEYFDPRREIDEIDAFLEIDISTDIKNSYHDSEGDIIYLEILLINDTIPNLPPKVFLDHDPKNLKDEPDNKDLKSMVKVKREGKSKLKGAYVKSSDRIQERLVKSMSFNWSTQGNATLEGKEAQVILDFALEVLSEKAHSSKPHECHAGNPCMDRTEGEPVKSQSSRRSRPAAMHNQSERSTVEYGVSTSTGYGVSSSLSNTAYSSQQINTAMTKVIKGEFEKIKDIKVEDDSLACDSPLEVFNCEVSRLSKMDDDLFTYEVEIANIPCDLRVDDDSEHEADDMGFDPSDIAFTEWLGSKFFNYKTMDHYTMKALWIYWIRGDDEVELTDEEFSDNEDEIAEVFRIDTNIFDYETPICSAFNKFNYLSKVGNLPETFIIENQLYYQDYEWYKALEDSELKDEALRNKAIMEGFIKDDDESSYEQMRRWDIHTNYDDSYKTNHDDNER
ncbi:hypothetical protein Tco_1174768 [Tanacetum coccineum]